MTLEKALEALEDKLQLIQSIGTVGDFNKWSQSTKMTFIHIYGEKDERVNELTRIQAYRDYGFGGSERVSEAKEEAESFLHGLIQDARLLDLPKKDESKKGGFNLNVSQHNNQNQSTNVTVNIDIVIEALTDELTGSQIKELKTILGSKEDPEIIKRTFLDKLRGFGENVASNVLINLLSNPQVYSQVFDKL